MNTDFEIDRMSHGIFKLSWNTGNFMERKFFLCRDEKDLFVKLKRVLRE